MPALVLKGVEPWDGSYPFADWRFTNRELHRIKEISGIRAGELLDALDSNDTAAFVGVAAVILARHGKHVDVDDLWEANIGSITIDLDAQEDDASPPVLPSGSETGDSQASSGQTSDANGG